MNIQNRIQSFFTLQLLPEIQIYILSNDKFFTTLFFKKFNLEYPFQVKEYSNHDIFYQEISHIEISEKSIPFVIIDNTYLNDLFNQKTQFEFVNEIQHRNPQLQIIFLDSINLELPNNFDSYCKVLKNDNSYKRIEQYIFTACNDFFLLEQKKNNKILFISLTTCIFLIVSFLTIYIFFFL